jgi:multiple sugar transport system ATP-binding protein
MDNSGLQLNQISKAYDAGQPVVSDVTFALSSGQCMVLVGPSGSGKTTLLRLIAGLEAMDQGTVYIHGQDVSAQSPQDRNVAMVLQGAPLYPHMTVQQNIAFPLKMKKTQAAEIHRRMAEVIPWLRLQGLLKRRPYSLSGGERQRVALAKALVCRPSVFLLDEPLSQVDAQHRSTIRTHLKETLGTLGIPTLYVTHDQREAMALGDRICVLHQGCVQQVGTPAQIYHEPINSFVGGFFGAPRMNLLKGKIERREGIWRFVLPNGPPLILLDTKSNQWAPYRNSTITLGIRPEHITTEIPGDKADFQGGICLVERLGAEICLHVRLSHDVRIVVSAHGNDVFKLGAQTGLRVDWPSIHVFE